MTRRSARQPLTSVGRKSFNFKRAVSWFACVLIRPCFVGVGTFVRPSHMLREAGEPMSSPSVFTDAPVCGLMLVRNISRLKIDIMGAQSNTQDHGGARRSGRAQPMTTAAAASFGALYCTGESVYFSGWALKRGARTHLVRIRDQFCASARHSVGARDQPFITMVTFTNVTLGRGSLMASG